MLKKGILATNSVYVCAQHTREFVSEYIEVLDRLFSTIANCESEKLNIDDLLEGPVCHTTFERLN